MHWIVSITTILLIHEWGVGASDPSRAVRKNAGQWNIKEDEDRTVMGKIVSGASKVGHEGRGRRAIEMRRRQRRSP